MLTCGLGYEGGGGAPPPHSTLSLCLCLILYVFPSRPILVLFSVSLLLSSHSLGLCLSLMPGGKVPLLLPCPPSVPPFFPPSPPSSPEPPGSHEAVGWQGLAISWGRGHPSAVR